MPQTAAGGTEFYGHPPAWVLLDTRARIGCCHNATTAEARTSDGHRIVVSFSVTDPPALSRCFVHCPDLTTEDFFGEPCVTGADGAVLLIRVNLAPRRHGGRWRFTDIFVYRAGPGGPSLCLLPGSYPLCSKSDHVGVLSCGEQYSVVVPRVRFEAGGWMVYDLSVLSSETASWSTVVDPVAVDADTDYDQVMHHPTRVISDDSTGGLWLAWVDLRRGVLLCNVVDDDRLPEMRFIQLPSLLGANKADYGPFEGPLRHIRDVTCKNGLMRFIEIEYPDLDDDCNDTEFRWTATMFTREICSESWDWCWTIDSADLCPADTCLPDLFPEIWDGKDLTLNKVFSSAPTLDQYDDNVFYMTAKLNAVDDTNGWVLVVNASDLTLERVVPFSSDRFDFDPTYQQCGFSKHLNKAPDDCTDAHCQLPN